MEDRPFKQAVPGAAWNFIAMYKYNDEWYVRVKDILHHFQSEYDFRIRLSDEIVKLSKIAFKVMCDGALCDADLVSMIPVTHLGIFLDSLGLPKEDWIDIWRCVMDCYTLHHLNEYTKSGDEN